MKSLRLVILLAMFLTLPGCQKSEEITTAPKNTVQGSPKQTSIEQIMIPELFIGHSIFEKDDSDQDVETVVTRLSSFDDETDLLHHRYRVAAGITKPGYGWHNGFVRIQKTQVIEGGEKLISYSGTQFIGPNYGGAPTVEPFHFKPGQPAFMIDKSFRHSGQWDSGKNLYILEDGKLEDIGYLVESQGHIDCDVKQIDREGFCYTAEGEINMLFEDGHSTPSFKHTVNIKVIDLALRTQSETQKNYIIRFDETEKRYLVPDWEKDVIECGESSNIGLSCQSW